MAPEPADVGMSYDDVKYNFEETRRTVNGTLDYLRDFVGKKVRGHGDKVEVSRAGLVVETFGGLVHPVFREANGKAWVSGGTGLDSIYPGIVELDQSGKAVGIKVNWGGKAGEVSYLMGEIAVKSGRVGLVGDNERGYVEQKGIPWMQDVSVIEPSESGLQVIKAVEEGLKKAGGGILPKG